MGFIFCLKNLRFLDIPDVLALRFLSKIDKYEALKLRGES